MNLSTIQSTLLEHGLRPTKSLGQNFLHDQNLAEWFVEQAELKPDDPWVEIGPGLGALTDYAVQRSGKGLLIEKDDRLIPYLRRRYPKLELYHGDGAQFDARGLFASGPLKILGNLPFYASSPILFNFTQEPAAAAALVLTMQKELAQRLTAKPGTKDFGAPTALIGRRWQVQLLRILPPAVFTPSPQVESAVVRLTPLLPEAATICDGGTYQRLIKRGFSQRRKQLRKMLGDEFPDWTSTASALGVPTTVRAEELGVTQWAALARMRDGTTGNHAGSTDAAEAAQDVHGEMFDIVDAEDRVLRTASRYEAHTTGLLHRAVHIFIFNRKGELFLQRRSRWKDVHPLRWDSSAAGHVPAGGNYLEAARRELQEELGVEAELKEIAAIRACPETGQEFVRLYEGRHEGRFRLPPAEIDTGGWFTPEQVNRWVAERPDDFATGFLKCWERAGGKTAEGRTVL